MHFRVLPAAVMAAAALALAAPAGAFDLTRAKTEAELLAARDGALFIRVNFRAELSVPPDPIVPPEPIDEDIVIGWGEVGGIDPEPFMVLIPAGCFVDRGGFRVEDFAGCGFDGIDGVEVSFHDGTSPTFLEIRDFAARISQRGNGTVVMDVEALVADRDQDSRRDPLEPAIMATLGGLPAEIAIDSVSSKAPVLKTEALSGIQPQPF